MVVHRGTCESGRVDQVGGPPDATTHESEDLHPLRIRERPAERDETVLARAVRRSQVRDETRRAVLGEHERRVGSRWGMRTTRSASGSGT